MKNRRGFTLVEVLVACAVIAILMGLLFLGGRAIINSNKAKSTRATLHNLEGMMNERGTAVGAAKVRSEIQALFVTAGAGSHDASVIKNVDPGSNSRMPATNNAVDVTQKTMALLLAIPANKTSVGNLPLEQMLERPASPPPTWTPVLLDGWGNPIIVCPSEPGLQNVVINGVSQTILASDQKIFFASAGPDGDFEKGDDNIYSFEK